MAHGRARKVLFLDLDGVLNSPTWFRHRGPAGDGVEIDHAIDPAAMARLNRLCAAVQPAIVISSTWRKIYPLTVLREHLHRLGLRADVVGRTPDLAGRYVVLREASGVVRRGAQRGDEIQRWLDAHNLVESFVILDDESDMAHLRHRLVQTSWEHGLLDADVDRCIAMLGGSPGTDSGTDRSGAEGGAAASAGPQPRRSDAPSPSTPEHTQGEP